MFPKEKEHAFINNKTTKNMVCLIGVIWCMVGLMSIVLFDPFTFTSSVAAFNDVQISAAHPIPCKVIRKQFTEGILQLPQYLQQVKSCKESLPLKRRQLTKPIDKTTRHLRQLQQQPTFLPWQQLYNELLLRKREQADRDQQRSLIALKQLLQQKQPVVQQKMIQLQQYTSKHQKLQQKELAQQHQKQTQQRRLNRRQFTQLMQPTEFMFAIPTQQKQNELQQKELVQQKEQQVAYMKWFTALKMHQQQQLIHQQQQQPVIQQQQGQLQTRQTGSHYYPNVPGGFNTPNFPFREKQIVVRIAKLQNKNTSKISKQTKSAQPDWKILTLPKEVFDMKSKDKKHKASSKKAKNHEKLVFKAPNSRLSIVIDKASKNQKGSSIDKTKVTNNNITKSSSKKLGQQKQNKVLVKETAGKNDKSKARLQEFLKTIKISDFQKMHGKKPQPNSNHSSQQSNVPFIHKGVPTAKPQQLSKTTTTVTVNHLLKPAPLQLSKAPQVTINHLKPPTKSSTPKQTTNKNQPQTKTTNNDDSTKEIKTNTDLEQALQNLLSTGSQQTINNGYYTDYTATAPYYSQQDTVQTKPYFYMPPATAYQWWQPSYRQFSRSFIEPESYNDPLLTPHLYPPFSSQQRSADESRVRKTFIDEEAKIAENRNGIRSFLSKQKSDTSLFEHEHDSKDEDFLNADNFGATENGNLLTLKDYEAFIAHPNNTSLTALRNSPAEEELEETGETRSMDNIVNGDDDDEVIAEATKIKEQSLAKSAIQSADNGGRQKDVVLHEQESLRKLEHDKLIERYGHPPANPLEYLAQVFQELDDDTKTAAEVENAKKKTDINDKNQVSSSSEPVLGESTKTSLEVNKSTNFTGNKTLSVNGTSLDSNSNKTLYTNGASLKGVNPITIKNDDAALLDSVFEKISSNQQNGDNKTTKVKRSPIIDADLEPWTNRHKYNQPVYPLGDIADIAMQVNKRSNIPKAWKEYVGNVGNNNAVDPSRLTYTQVRKLFTDINKNAAKRPSLSLTKRSNELLLKKDNVEVHTNIDGDDGGFLR